MARYRQAFSFLIILTICVHLNHSHSLPRVNKVLSYHGRVDSSVLKSSLEYSVDIAVSIAMLSRENINFEAAIYQLRNDVTKMIRDLNGMLSQQPLAIRILLIANFIIFSSWIFLPQQFMIDNFSESKYNSRNGRWWTIITCALSHRSLTHLLLNMYGLQLFGPQVYAALGDKLFLAFTLISGAVSSLCFKLGRSTSLLLAPRDIQQIDRSRPSLGFSGVNCAILVLYAALKPDELISIAGFKPIPAQLAIKRLVLMDLFGFVLQSTLVSSPIAHGAHLGGYFAGYLFRNILCQKFLGKYLSRKCRRLFCNKIF